MNRPRSEFPPLGDRPVVFGLGMARRIAVATVFVVAATAATAEDTAADRPPAAATFAEYLTTWKIDRDSRSALEEGTEWTAAKQSTALRILGRLVQLPGNLASRWSRQAPDLAAEPPGQRLGDRLVRVEGRAVMVTPLDLSQEEATLAGRERVEIVRIVSANGTAIDVLTDRVPRPWKRSAPIDEPAAAVGLPLLEAGGPPTAADGLPAVVVAAASVAWFPATPLGLLGVDYGLFDRVVDGQRLVAGDTEAFYAVLAAAGRESPPDTQPEAEAHGAAAATTDIVPLIDPSRGWFAEHRGEPIAIEGVVRRATRISVDDATRREQIGTDHYWELFVFVPTPLIKINDRLQEDYPVVCCVRTLPPGMPTGQQIGERVRIEGFAFKRYGYPLPDVQISSSQGDEARKGLRQETALIIAKTATWLPQPSPNRAVNTLGWVFLALATAVGVALAAAAWSFSRDVRSRRQRSRDAFPDRIELP